jgi:hypothetical protein
MHVLSEATETSPSVGYTTALCIQYILKRKVESTVNA